MRHTDLDILKCQLISKIETELWRDTGLRITINQFEELRTYPLTDLTKLVDECKKIESEYRKQRKAYAI